MKARIKTTGEVYTVVGITHDDPAYFPQYVFHLGNDKWYPYKDVELIGEDTTDWQQVRIQAAIAAMQSYISDGERMALVSKKFDYDDKIISKFIAEGAVMYADALIAELKKGWKDEND